MILVLHACLPALRVVIMGHVEPGTEKRRGVKDGERAIRNTHKVIIGCLMAKSQQGG